MQNKNRVNVYLRFTRFFSKLLIKSNYFDSNSALPLAHCWMLTTSATRAFFAESCDVGRLRAHELYGDWTAMIISSIYVIDNFTSIPIKTKCVKLLSQIRQFFIAYKLWTLSLRRILRLLWLHKKQLSQISSGSKYMIWLLRNENGWPKTNSFPMNS